MLHHHPPSDVDAVQELIEFDNRNKLEAIRPRALAAERTNQQPTTLLMVTRRTVFPP